MFWFILTILVILFLYQKWKIRHFSKMPGPRLWPFVGNTFQLLSSPEQNWNFVQNQNKKFYPIYKLINGFTPLVQILNPNDIEIILSSTENLSKSQIYGFLQSWLGTGLLTSDGEKWHTRRKLLTPSFHFNIIQQFFEIFLEHSMHLVIRLQDECTKHSTNLKPLITQFTLHAICETAMGTKLNEHTKENANYINAVYRIGQLSVERFRKPWLFIDTIYKFTAMGKEENHLIKTLHTFSMSVIEKRKQDFKLAITSAVRNDLEFKPKQRLAMLDVLLSTNSNGVTISNEGVREEVDTFMFAGHDTTTAAITFALMLLAHHPNIQKKVLEEINSVMNNRDSPFRFSDIQQLHYLQLVIKETLRIYPSAPSIGRKTNKDIVTATGYVIPKNTYVGIQIYALHHNPHFFPNPEKFDPERFLPENSKGRHPYSYIPFSAGPRNCIGQRFAMVEMKTVIASIIRNYELLPIDKPDNLTLISQLILKTKEDIRIKFKQR